VPEARRRKGFASAALLRGLGCSSAAASQAYAPAAGSAAAAAVRSSADWHGRRRKGKDGRRKERGGGGGGGGLVAGGIGTDVWCAPGIPFAAEASSVDCVVARHQMLGRGRGGEADRPHREVRPWLLLHSILAASSLVWICFVLAVCSSRRIACSWWVVNFSLCSFVFSFQFSLCVALFFCAFCPLLKRNRLIIWNYSYFRLAALL
jgi:hypothetical protein